MRVFASTLAWILLAVPSGAQTPLGLPQTVSPVVPIGDIEDNVAVASQPDGRSLVVWCGRPAPGADFRVMGQLRDGTGLPLGPVLALSNALVGEFSRPEVARHPDGGFVVVWDGAQQGSSARARVLVRRVGADGLPYGAEKLVTSVPASQRPVVEVAAGGSFVVAWHTFATAVYVRAFDATCAPLGAESQANVFTYSNRPSLAMLSARGDFVVTWNGHPGGPNPTPYDIFARLYSANGEPAGDPFVVNTQTVGSQQGAAVVANDGGGFLITWSTYAPPDRNSTLGRHYDSAGNPLDAPFSIQDETAHDPHLVALPDGQRLLVWERQGIYARRLQPNGRPAGPIMRVSPPDGLWHRGPSAAATPGGFTVVWTTFGAAIAANLQSYALASQARADFDGNGREDVVFRHAKEGAASVWLMNGLTRQDERLFDVEARGLDWKLAGVADFDADGWPDLLWRNAAADQTELWLMEEVKRREVMQLPARGGQDGPAWQVAAVSDFDLDRRPDLLWRHETTGAVEVWPMAGAAFAGTPTPLPAMDSGWTAVGAADFDGNGAADIAWHRPADGALSAWLLEARPARPIAVLGQVPFAPSAVPDTAWRPVAVADYDGDGGADLLWQRQAQGTLVAWMLDGIQRTGAAFLTPSVPSTPAWQVVGPR